MAWEPSQQGEPEDGAFVFFSYSHKDKRFRDKLEDHLSILKYRGLISTWHDREIHAGEEWAQQIDIHLEKAHILLLLISSDFMSSQYCYGIEMKRALERHDLKEAERQRRQAEIEDQRRQEAFETARKQNYYKKVVDAYEVAISRNPSDIGIYRGMGNAFYALGYYYKTYNAFRIAIKLGPSSAAYAGLGDVLVKLKQYNEAVVAYEKAIELDPTVTLNYDGFILSLQKLGREEEAESVHIRAKQLGYEDEDEE